MHYADTLELVLDNNGTENRHRSAGGASSAPAKGPTSAIRDMTLTTARRCLALTRKKAAEAGETCPLWICDYVYKQKTMAEFATAYAMGQHMKRHNKPALDRIAVKKHQAVLTSLTNDATSSLGADGAVLARDAVVSELAHHHDEGDAASIALHASGMADSPSDATEARPCAGAQNRARKPSKRSRASTTAALDVDAALQRAQIHTAEDCVCSTDGVHVTDSVNTPDEINAHKSQAPKRASRQRWKDIDPVSANVGAVLAIAKALEAAPAEPSAVATTASNTDTHNVLCNTGAGVARRSSRRASAGMPLAGLALALQSSAECSDACASAETPSTDTPAHALPMHVVVQSRPRGKFKSRRCGT